MVGRGKLLNLLKCEKSQCECECWFSRVLIIRTRSNVKFAQPHIWWKKALNFPSHMVSLQGSGCKPPALSPLCASPLELLGPSSSCTHSLGFECWLSAWAFWFNMSVWGTFKNSIYYLSNTVTTSFFASGPWDSTLSRPTKEPRCRP